MKNFYDLPKESWIDETEYFFLIRDGFPVSKGHTLIITKALKADYFELSSEEKSDLHIAIDRAKELVEKEFKPDGYNIGVNCGLSAGQSIFHFHCHLIPRYNGDMKNPKGGVRHCVEGKGLY